MEISKPGLVETCGTLAVTGRQKAPETLKVALASLAAKGRPCQSRRSLLRVSWLLRLILLLSSEKKANPMGNKDMGGYARLPLLLCL